MEPGTRLGPYEVLEQLGAGGMGEVYLARDTRLGRRVAVKILPTEFATDPERLARFEQEARAAAALNHPNIAAVFDVGVAGEGSGQTRYMVQEYLEGQSLEDLLASGPLSRERAVALAAEIAAALAAAHVAGIVHRDLKPANVFVTPEGTAKVLDFGLAKLTETAATSGGDASLSPTMIGTMAGTVMGTAGYMAPEQAQGEDVDHRADFFALGCVLYEMTTGSRPFAGDNVYETIGKIVSKDPEPLEARLPGAPAELRRIVGKCLAKDRAMRYQAAGDLAIDLRVLLRELESGRVGSTEESVQDGPVASRALSPGLVAALLLLAAAGSFVASRALQPAVTEPPMKTFEIDFPAEYPRLMPCCANNLVLSPDDAFLALVSLPSQGGVGNGVLAIRRLDAPGFVRLGDFNAYNIDISPDGEWVVYNDLGSGGNEIRLKKVALAGGAPFDLGVMGIAPPSWAEDGYIYLARGGSVRRVSEDGGDVEELVVAGAEEFADINQLFAVPGSRALLLGVGDGGFGLGPGRIVAMDRVSRAAVELIDEGTDPRWSPTGHLLWSRAGDVYAAAFDPDELQLVGRPALVLPGVATGLYGESNYSVSDAGTLVRILGDELGVDRFVSTLEWVDGDGDVTQVSARQAAYVSARAASDGNRVAAGIVDTEGIDVWVFDEEQGAAVRLTSDRASEGPVWSNDDTWVYFTNGSTRASGDIWRRRADFSGPAEPVLERPLRQRVTDVSPDGRFLVFEERQPGAATEVPTDIWLLPLDGGDPVPVGQAAFREAGARFSPDGNLIAYISSESGIEQVYVREIDGGRQALASAGEERSSWLAWARDGRTLYYSSADEIFEVQVEVTETVMRVSPPRRLVSLDRGIAAPLDVGADGRFLVVRRLPRDPATQAAIEEPRILVTLNWFQELRRLAPRDR